MRPVAINKSDRSWTRHSYVLWFGACGPTRVLVYADSLEDALEIAADWLAEHAPGHFSPPDYEYEAKERGLAWPMPNEIDPYDHDSHALARSYNEALDAAECDHTYTESGWLLSWEWGIVAEDPSPRDLADLYGATCGSCGAGGAAHKPTCDRLAPREVQS